MTKYRGPEVRKYERLHKRIGLNIIGYNNKKTLPKFDEEVGLNISIGGILIECSKRLSKGTNLKLKIMLTFDSSRETGSRYAGKYKIAHIPAKIIWNKKSLRNTYYFGCKFIRLKPKDKASLIKYTKNNLH